MGKITRIHTDRNANSDVSRSVQIVRNIQYSAPTVQEPPLWTKAWTLWFVGKHVHELVRIIDDDSVKADDSTLWATLLADELKLGWYHDDLYGILSRIDPLFVPVDLGQTVTTVANFLRAMGVTVEKSVTRAKDVETALSMILPRPVDGDWIHWDRDHWNQHQGIVFTNGVLDLDTLQVRSLTETDRATWRIPYRWIGGQPLPPTAVQFWLTHFQNLFGDDDEAKLKTRALLVRSAVALTPWIRGPQWQKALLLIGPGQNGKGTWIRLWMAILGKLLQSLSVIAYDTVSRFGLTNLKPDTLVAATPDMDENAKLRGTERFKKLTGDDPIDWERKNRDIVTTQFQARVWLAGPVVPKVSDTSNGMYRRLKDSIILFDRQQPDDPGYEERMATQDNIETLLVIAVTKLSQVVQGRVPMPIPVTAATALEEYRRQIEPWEQWIDPDDGWLELDPTGWVPSKRLYQVYQHWYQGWTGQRFPKYMNPGTFGKKMSEHLGTKVGRGSNSTKGYLGVKIQPEFDRLYDEEF